MFAFAMKAAHWALVISTFSLFVSMLGFAWNVAQYRLLGPKVRLEVRAGWTVNDGTAIVMPVDRFARPAALSIHDASPVMWVTITNVGRTSLSIITFEMLTDVDRWAITKDVRFRLPCRLGPGDVQVVPIRLLLVMMLTGALEGDAIPPGSPADKADDLREADHSRLRSEHIAFRVSDSTGRFAITSRANMHKLINGLSTVADVISDDSIVWSVNPSTVDRDT